jgi:Fe-S cluster assembly ATPase SufC
MLNYIPPSQAHLLLEGQVAASSGPELADEIDQHGYEAAYAKYGRKAG